MKSPIIRIFACALVLFLLAVPAFAEEAHVLRVIDGDTLRVEIHGEPVNLRLLGVDAPERNEAGGPEATAFVKQWVAKGGTVDIEYGKRRYGKYGRLLAWIWRDGQLLQEELIRTGHAEVKWISKKDKHYGRLTAAKE